MADVMEVDAPRSQVKLVKDTVVANPKFELRAGGQTPVWKRFELSSHFTHFPLHGFTDGWIEVVE